MKTQFEVFGQSVRAIKKFETPEEAVDYGASQLYMKDAERQEHIDRLKAGGPTIWTCGFGCVEIEPVQVPE